MEDNLSLSGENYRKIFYGKNFYIYLDGGTGTLRRGVTPRSKNSDGKKFTEGLPTYPIAGKYSRLWKVYNPLEKALPCSGRGLATTLTCDVFKYLLH